MSKLWTKTKLKRKFLTPYKSALGFFLILLIAAIGIRVHCSTNLAVKNSELKELTERKAQAKKDILTLTYENSSLSSLQEVETRAKDLGFVELTQPIVAVNQGITPQVASLQ